MTDAHPITLLVSGFLGFICIYIFYSIIVSSTSKRTQLPRVSNKKRWFLAKLRTRIWTTRYYGDALKIAYDDFAKHDQPCILAGLDGDTILLPQSAIPWMVAQPENVLSVNGSHKHVLQTRYTFPRPEVMDPTVHFDIVRSELTRQLFTVTPEVCDELAAAVDEIWGTSTKTWGFVKVFDSLTRIIARVNNRVFVGLPLCRDEKYIENATGFAEDIALSSTALRMIPGSLRLLASRFVTKSNRKHAHAFTQILTPEIQRRQQELRDAEPVGDTTKDGGDGDTHGKNDFLQWLLTRSLTKSHTKPDETDPNIISARLLHINFASVHTTSFIASNALLDILAAPTDQKVPEKLEAEAHETMDDAELDNDAKVRSWARNALPKMKYLDSALRESSRRSSIIGVGVNHKVVAKGGVTTPEGTFLPQGSLVAVHSGGVHNDGEVCDGPGEYKPFRYVDGGAAEQFTATSTTYLGFGHGRHSCPGRSFAANELKLLLSYLLVNYDMQMVMEGGVGGVWNGKGHRPECEWMGPMHVFPDGAKLRIRRKVVD
ncbi:cytochrome P450 [Exophiala viscosa]|uniref:Cytochrome P450 n=2 Tax=Exophiala viscosa TaxID=2486360 RepID=A0AAN6DZI2_9EURO|nr:cytochrome P450 [Exophiala viscosa]